MVTVRGMKGQRWTLLLWSAAWVLQSSLLVVLVNAKCAVFEFPTAKSKDDIGRPIVIVPKKQTISIPFVLNTHGCSDRNQTFNIVVSKEVQGRNFFKDFCKLTVKAGSVIHQIGSENCAIESDKGEYSLSKNVDGSDTTFLRWRTDSSEKIIAVHLSYPPRITKISREPPSASVKPGSSVKIVCSYEEGRYSATPNLKDAQGQVLTVTHDHRREIRHTIHGVSCDDSGSFRCEAPMALGNMTTTLLVQCSPVFWEDGQVMKQFEVDLDQPTKLMFQIHAHTKDLSECWLFPWQKNHTAPLPPPSSTKGKENCLGFAETFGSPPNLTLSLRLNKVTWSNVGTWQLMISNKAGTGGVIFSVDLPATLSRPVWTTIVPLDQNASTTTRGPFFQPDPIDEGDEDESDSAAATAAVAAVLVIIVVIVVIVAVVVLKRHYGARVGRLFRIIWRRDVPEQPQQVSSIYCATEANTDRREGRRDEIRGGHLYRALYGPSPTPDNIYEDPENPENPPAYHC